MTVGELRKALAELPADMLVLICDHRAQMDEEPEVGVECVSKSKEGELLLEGEW